MDAIDLTSLLPALTKTGAAGVVLALLVGTAQVINAWRGGNISKAKEGDLVKQVEELRQQLISHATRIAEQEKRVTALMHQLNNTAYQRNDARLYAEYLELLHNHEPKKVWKWELETQETPQG